MTASLSPLAPLSPKLEHLGFSSIVFGKDPLAKRQIDPRDPERQGELPAVAKRDDEIFVFDLSIERLVNKLGTHRRPPAKATTSEAASPRGDESKHPFRTHRQDVPGKFQTQLTSINRVKIEGFATDSAQGEYGTKQVVAAAGVAA